MRRWVVPVIVFAVLAALLVTGLAVAGRSLDRGADVGPPAATSSESPAPSSEAPSAEPSEKPDASVTEPPDPALAPFYSQTLDWQPCDGSFECATLEVPVDYRGPAGETIDLALLRAPTTPWRPTGSSAGPCSMPSTSSASTRAAPAKAVRSTA